MNELADRLNDAVEAHRGGVPSLSQRILESIDHSDAVKHRNRVLVVEPKVTGLLEQSPKGLLEQSPEADKAFDKLGRLMAQEVLRRRRASKPSIESRLMESIEDGPAVERLEVIRTSPGRLLEQAPAKDKLHDAMQRIGERRGTG